MFGVALVPMLLGVGYAVDMSVAVSNKKNLQDATDMAVLAAATFKGTENERETFGGNVFFSNVDSARFNVDPTITFDLTTAGFVTGTASGNNTRFFRGFSGDSLEHIEVSAQSVSAGIGNAEIVFVLDYSSSMNGQYEAMRDATISLVNGITDNGLKTDVKIGLVPFANEVYVEMDGRYVNGGTFGAEWSNCTASRDWPFVKKDQTPTSAAISKWGLLDDDYDEITDPDYYDDCDEYVANDLIVRPLTNDHMGTVSQLENMEPYAGTNISTGMEFGWQVISPNAPWIEGTSYADLDWKKYIILLSDGENNHAGFGPGHTYSTAQANENLQTVCSEAKDLGIMIITVGYELEDAGAIAALRSCATSDRHYLQGSEENILEVFETVGEFFADETYLIQ